MKHKSNFSFFRAGLLTAGLLLLTMTPPARAQMHGGAPMGGQPNNNMNNMNNNMAPDGMQPNGLNAPQNNTQMIEHNTFGNLRRNFDVETDLSKMALKNSTNDDVKKFAQQVIADNHRLSNQLIVPNNGNGPMFDSEMVPSQTQKAKKQMKKMTGAPFDQMYLVQMDAYVKNDQETAHNAVAMMSLPKVSEVGMQVQTMSDQREKQIADLTKEAGFKIQ
jgi:predicted outer membrane protein